MTLRTEITTDPDRAEVVARTMDGSRLVCRLTLAYIGRDVWDLDALGSDGSIAGYAVTDGELACQMAGGPHHLVLIERIDEHTTERAMVYVTDGDAILRACDTIRAAVDGAPVGGDS